MTATEKNHPDAGRASSRRRQVLDAAQACFACSGFHGASMAQISKTAGMSAGHIYNYFDNKDAIIAAFVQENMERTVAILGNIENHADPLAAMIEEIGTGIVDHLDPANATLQLEIFAEAARNPKIAALVRQADHAALSQLRTILASARRKRGLAADDPTIAARSEVIASIMQGLYSRTLQNPHQDSAALIEHIRMAMHPLLFGD
jgi:AcrR family transcriptional regulator